MSFGLIFQILVGMEFKMSCVTVFIYISNISFSIIYNAIVEIQRLMAVIGGREKESLYHVGVFLFKPGDKGFLVYLILPMVISLYLLPMSSRTLPWYKVFS